MKSNSFILLLSSIAICLYSSCQREIQQLQNSAVERSLATNALSSGINNVNVVYFIPSDLDTVPGYRERLNGVMQYTQNFIAKWMDHWGYTNKYLGLPVDSQGKIKLAVIRGAQPKSSYPYEGGAGAVMNEINTYYAANPTEKSSDHILVIMPAYSFGSNGDPSGGPFYGIGRWCFALDYPGLDTLNFGLANDNFATKWIGGLAHELGHGINLPHNGGAQSENLQFGTTLMGYGNGTFGRSATYLSPADAAILANAQPFSHTPRTDWYASPGFQLNKLYAKYENGDIVVSGKFVSQKLVKNIAYYHRNKGNDNGGYNSVTFANKPVGVDSFYVRMPVSDFRDKANTDYEFTIRFIHENGSISSSVNDYSFANDLPIINFGDRPAYSKANWSISSFSSQETAAENGLASNIIDNAVNTYWHSRWSSNSTSYPHEIVVNMGASMEVNRFTFRQRNSRQIKDLEILVSTNGTTWTSLGDFVLNSSTSPQDISLPTVYTFRYFKLLMKSSHDGQQFGALAEVDTYKD